ncbi:MAG: penicillin-binding transpeptidase domain-containing protein, partial [Pseudomonadota bacterium]
ENSAVWVYQEITRAAGQATMANALARFDYGNEDVGTADRLTTYWLDDTLRISAMEQVVFLTNLAERRLPLSDDTYASAFAIMESDSGANWIMRSKTGWRFSETSIDVGWHVGWLECSDKVYVFALNMDMPDTRYLSRRTAITYAVLEEIGAFDCEG